MSPHPTSRLEPSAGSADSLPASDLICSLEQYVASGFPPDLALDLVFHEVVVRAAEATGANAAALALFRDDELVCRAATGPEAPDLGVPLDTRGGLSGACVRTRTPQLCDDAESDPRLDSAAARLLGIRSILIVPVFDAKPEEDSAPGAQPDLTGILELLSPLPNTFSLASQSLLEGLVRECAQVRRAADHLRDHPPAAVSVPSNSEPPKSSDPDMPNIPGPASALRQPYEAWTLVLGGLVIFAVLSLSFMVGSRLGWLPSLGLSFSNPRSASSSAPSGSPAAPAKSHAAPRAESPRTSATPKPPAKSLDTVPPISPGELVVYEKGKIIFRKKSPPSQPAAISQPVDVSAPHLAPDEATAKIASPVVSASSSTRLALRRAVRLSPDEADNRLVSRVEPVYPPEALAAHRSGAVTLEIDVTEDGTVSSVRTLTGDPLLAAAAAEAIRQWRYEPYRSHKRPSSFQTDVTLTFSLPK